MTEWLAGNRIRGTSTERTTGTGFIPVIGGWKEVGRTTLGSDTSTITVSSLADKRYYMVLTQGKTSQTNGDFALRYNGDSGANYAVRQTWNGGSDNTYINQTHIRPLGTVIDLPFFNIDYIANLSSKEKLIIGHGVDDTVAGSGTAPSREEHVAKWTNTSDALSQVQALLVNGTPNYRSGSEVVVLGWDDSDTHSTNFWEELASVSGAGSSTTLSSGTITAKKYLWVQVYADTATSACGFQFNNDTGANYARRYNSNGGTDGTQESHTSANISGNSPNAFINCFIINNSANEKLLMCNTVYAPASGAGDDPERSDDYSKWANTSSQITEIDVIKGSNWGTNSIIKVWGSN